MYHNEAKLLANRLLKGDLALSWDLINTIDNLGMNSCYIYDQVLTKAMYIIGEQWQRNEITVADEHLATATVDFILSRYMVSKDRHNASENKALFFCIEGEEHVIGLKMAASYFKEKGWDTQYLGANLPLDYALYSARKWEPAIIGISVSMVHHLTKLSDYVKELEQLPFQPTIVVGSRLLEQYDLRPYCSNNTLFFSNIEQIQSWLTEFITV